MKKMRFFILLSLLITALITFNSCVGGIPDANSFDTVLNAEYEPEEKIANKVVKIEELSGYQFLEAKGEFVTFVKTDVESGISRAVFSTRNKKVVYVAESNSSESVEVKLVSGMPAFTVTRIQIACADAINERDAVCELYDANGTLVTQVKGTTPTPVLFADTVLFNNASYSINESDGALSKIADISENLYVEDCSDWNDEYFYTYGDSVNVYDRAFNHVYSWTIPSWGKYLSQNMLNNGNVLVQYTRPLDANTEDYDIYEMDENTGETKKFDVYTVLLDPKKGVEKEIKLDYIVEQVTTGGELISVGGENGIYRDGVDNVAYIYPITNGQVDYSVSSADIVLMDNSAKMKKSLKILDDQRAALPTYVADNVYLVSTVYGSALIDIDGKLLHQINNETVATVGQNIVSDSTVYTLDMEKVYSLYDNDASIATYLNGTVFVKKGADTEYSIIAINGTQEKEICKYSALAEQRTYFDALDEVGCYALCNVVKGEYLYYNSNHELLYTSSHRFDYIAADYGMGVSVYSTTVEDQVDYYVIY